MSGVVIDRPICMECGHDLSALAQSGACPECGTGYTETSRFPPPAPKIMSVLGPVLWRLTPILVWMVGIVAIGVAGLFRSSESDFSVGLMVALVVLVYGFPLIWLVLMAMAARRAGRMLCTRIPRMTRERALIPGVPFTSRSALAQISAIAIVLLVAVALLLVLQVLVLVVAFSTSRM